MITRLEIDSLFGLYSYDLDFTNEDGTMLKIITGPNGYGKTSILRLINALYSRDFNTFFDIPFKLLKFHIDDVILEVEQERTLEYDGESDIQSVKSELLILKFFNSEGSNPEIIKLNRLGENFLFDKDGLSQFNLFMNSRSCFFISDDRLVSYKTDTVEEDGKSERAFLQRDIQMFRDILANNEQGVQNKLELFKDIIHRSAFADKEMQINSINGIRFKSKSEIGEFLDLDKLSSGEKHILLQTLELLFIAQDGMVSLVDEPELSLHPAWLNQYIDNLLNILNAKSDIDHKFQIIIATHSPQLIGQRWDNCVDLYEKRVK